MHNLTHAPELSETLAMGLIFDACRASPDRKPYPMTRGYAVSFTVLADGTHEACLRYNGVVMALANVDEFDC